MSKNSEKNIEQLYRQYQEKRDSIPTPVLKKLMDAAKLLAREDTAEEPASNTAQIQLILNAAQSASESSAAQTHNKKQAPSSSFKDQLQQLWNRWFSSSTFGNSGWMTVPALAIVIMVAVNIIPSLHTNRLDISYLDNCLECSDIATSSVIKLRNINLDQASLQAANNIVEFGRLSLSLELINHTPTGNIQAKNSAIINTIKQLANEDGQQQISQYFKQFDRQHSFSQADINATVDFLNKTFSEPTATNLFYAGQWLERLYITNEYALRTQQFSLVQKSLDGIDPLLAKLQQNHSSQTAALSYLNQLAQLQQSEHITEPQAKQVTTLIKEILGSLAM